MSLSLAKKPDSPDAVCIPVMFTKSTARALEDLRRRFPDETEDNLINHAVQVFWARTCSFNDDKWGKQ